MHSESTARYPDEDLSALVDGEIDANAAARLAGQWRDDAALRSRWHAYHLIGDVLRSDDLAQANRDAALWAAVHERIAQEPVVLAPEVKTAAARVPRRWMASAAVAAGFVAVAGALVVTGTPGGRESAPAQIARAPESIAPVAQVAQVAAAPASTVIGSNDERAAAANSAVIRDARLERYLAAHQQFGGSSALGVPSGFLRSATYEAPSR